MKPVWNVSLAFFLLLISCNGGKNAPSIPTIPGPTQLTAAYDPSKAKITLTWLPPASTIDGFNLESGVHGEAFSQINQGLIPSNYNGAILTFTSLPPEFATIDFRLRAVSNGVNSPYSNVAEVTIPLLSPNSLNADFSPVAGGVQLYWGNPSHVADRDVLERAVCDTAGNPSGPWSRLVLPSPIVSSFLDLDVLESQAYVYRVTAWKGDVSSAMTGPTPRIVIPPLAPTAFSAQSLLTAISLTWTNRSKTATQIQITRKSLDENALNIATLPPTATAYQDNSVPLGYYTYGINVTDGMNSATGPTILAASANPLGSPVLVATSMTSGARIDTAALSLSGLWAFGTTSPFSILPASWASWPAWSPANVFAPLPEFMELDGQSLPHAAYRTQDASTSSLTHAWFDGTQWRTEVVQSLISTQSYLTTSLCLDKAGNPQTLQDTGGSTPDLVYSRKIAGIWIQENLHVTTGWEGHPRLFLDQTDTPHVLVPTWFNTREFSRNGDGSWTSQILTNMVPSGGGYLSEDGVWSDAGKAWVFYQHWDFEIPGNAAFRVVQKVNGVWQQPVLLKSFSRTAQPAASIALSRDGTRVAAVCYTYTGLKLFTQTSQGWIESLLPVPTLEFPYFKIAFDGGNHLHVFVKPSAYTSDIVDFHE